MSPIVSCKDISKRFDKTEVLPALTLDIEEGELFFLLGPSGCGKTTLLRIIAGLIQQDSGKLEIAMRDMHAVAPEQRGVGMVFQNYALWPHLNVRQHVEFGLNNKQFSSQEIKNKVTSVLELLQIAELAARFPHELSGGQQQRVSLARALAPQPKLLLLDEPLSNLDPKLREEMRQELKAVQRELGLTFIYVTHDRSEALAIGDRIAILQQGRLQQVGKPLDLYFKPENAFVAEFLGETNLFQGQCEFSTDGRFGIKSDFGFIPIPDIHANSNNKASFLFCIRPEDIIIETLAENTTQDPCVCGHILRIVPFGVISQVIVKLTDTRNITCFVSIRESLRFQEGMKVGLKSSWDKISILKS